jgi:hypothetical protein
MAWVVDGADVGKDLGLEPIPNFGAGARRIPKSESSNSSSSDDGGYGLSMDHLELEIVACCRY